MKFWIRKAAIDLYCIKIYPTFSKIYIKYIIPNWQLKL